MFDFLAEIKERLPDYKKSCENKGIKIDFERLFSLDMKRKTLIQRIESIRKERNEISELISKNPKTIEKSKTERVRSLKDILSELERELNFIEKELLNILYRVPNIHSDDTPIGKDDSSNVPTEYFGKVPRFDFPVKDHIELGTSLDILDLDRGVKVHGFRGYFLKNEGAIMHLAVLFLAMEKMLKYGYTPIIAPSIVKEFCLFSTGHFPAFKDDVYEILNAGKNDKGEDLKEKLFLSGTAEIPLVSYHSGEVLSEEELPKKYVGFSPCYRSEVGSYGKDTKGIYRLHEFMKVEQVVICKADYDESEKYHKEMMQISHEILDDLKLPHRFLRICTGDMGAGKYKMFDIETWMPSRNSYGETHSASNLTNWQARRANIKYLDKKSGEKKYVFMLNNTALASPRILIAIWENYQNADGSITVPEVLRKWVGKDRVGKAGRW